MLQRFPVKPPFAHLHWNVSPAATFSHSPCAQGFVAQWLVTLQSGGVPSTVAASLQPSECSHGTHEQSSPKARQRVMAAAHMRPVLWPWPLATEVATQLAQPLELLGSQAGFLFFFVQRKEAVAPLAPRAHETAQDLPMSMLRHADVLCAAVSLSGRQRLALHRSHARGHAALAMTLRSSPLMCTAPMAPAACCDFAGSVHAPCKGLPFLNAEHFPKRLCHSAVSAHRSQCGPAQGASQAHVNLPGGTALLVRDSLHAPLTHGAEAHSSTSTHAELLRNSRPKPCAQRSQRRPARPGEHREQKATPLHVGSSCARPRSAPRSRTAPGHGRQLVDRLQPRGIFVLCL